jgi:hypothetical protein
MSNQDPRVESLRLRAIEAEQKLEALLTNRPEGGPHNAGWPVLDAPYDFGVIEGRDSLRGAIRSPLSLVYGEACGLKKLGLVLALPPAPPRSPTIGTALEWWGQLLAALGSEKKPRKRNGKKRRRVTARKPTPLTAKQTEAIQLVGENKGNVSAAARAAGKSRQAMQKLYEKGMRKLGRSAAPLKRKTEQLPIDKRGQDVVLGEEE